MKTKLKSHFAVRYPFGFTVSEFLAIYINLFMSLFTIYLGRTFLEYLIQVAVLLLTYHFYPYLELAYARISQN